MAHEVQYSELHTTAAVCAPCHEYPEPRGHRDHGHLLGMQQSPAAKDGRSCQTCHMNRTEAEVVDARVARVPDAEVNLHDVPGGHSITQLNKALAVTFNPKRSEGHLVLDVVSECRGRPCRAHRHALASRRPGNQRSRRATDRRTTSRGPMDRPSRTRRAPRSSRTAATSRRASSAPRTPGSSGRISDRDVSIPGLPAVDGIRERAPLL